MGEPLCALDSQAFYRGLVVYVLYGKVWKFTFIEADRLYEYDWPLQGYQ